jgi:hypothetical protein
MKTQLAEIPTRVYKNRYNTGVYELMAGGIFLVGGLSLNAGNHVLMVLLFILGIVIVARLIQQIEKKYIYPRSGYVKFREEGSQLWKNMLLILGLNLLFGFAFWLVFTYDDEYALAWITPILATMLGCVMLISSFYHRIRRMSFVGILLLFFGWILSPLVLGAEATHGYIGFAILAFYLLIIGVIFLTSGGLTLRNYLLHTMLLQQEAQDE